MGWFRDMMKSLFPPSPPLPDASMPHRFDEVILQQAQEMMRQPVYTVDDAAAKMLWLQQAKANVTTYRQQTQLQIRGMRATGAYKRGKIRSEPGVALLFGRGVAASARARMREKAKLEEDQHVMEMQGVVIQIDATLAQLQHMIGVMRRVSAELKRRKQH